MRISERHRCGLSGLNLAKTVPCGYALSENPMSDLRLPDKMHISERHDVVCLPPSNAPPLPDGMWSVWS